MTDGPGRRTARWVLEELHSSTLPMTESQLCEVIKPEVHGHVRMGLRWLEHHGFAERAAARLPGPGGTSKPFPWQLTAEGHVEAERKLAKRVAYEISMGLADPS